MKKVTGLASVWFVSVYLACGNRINGIMNGKVGL
jgi:hypothetical protein